MWEVLSMEHGTRTPVNDKLVNLPTCLCGQLTAPPPCAQDYPQALLPKIKVYKLKQKEGVIERVGW